MCMLVVPIVLTGLISGYSSERQSLERQLQAAEEQREILTGELELTRSRLNDFQQAADELEARQLDVERQQNLLQAGSGQETRGLNIIHRTLHLPLLSLARCLRLSATFGVLVGSYVLYRCWHEISV